MTIKLGSLLGKHLALKPNLYKAANYKDTARKTARVLMLRLGLTSLTGLNSSDFDPR